MLLICELLHDADLLNMTDVFDGDQSVRYAGQRDRRGLEVERYPHLVEEIIRRVPGFCQHWIDLWEAVVLTA